MDRLTAADVDVEEVIVPTRRGQASTYCFHLPRDEAGLLPLCDTTKKNGHIAWRRVPIDKRPMSARRLCRRCQSASDEHEGEVDTQAFGPKLPSYLQAFDDAERAMANYQRASAEFEERDVA
jgi:hypothetical protein